MASKKPKDTTFITDTRAVYTVEFDIESLAGISAAERKNAVENAFNETKAKALADLTARLA